MYTSDRKGHLYFYNELEVQSQAHISANLAIAKKLSQQPCQASLPMSLAASGEAHGLIILREVIAQLHSPLRLALNRGHEWSAGYLLSQGEVHEEFRRIVRDAALADESEWERISVDRVSTLI